MALWMNIATAFLRALATTLKKQRDVDDDESEVEGAKAPKPEGAPRRRRRPERPTAPTMKGRVGKLDIKPPPPGGGAIMARCKGGEVDD